MNLVLEDTIRPIRYRFLGREVKNIRGTGKFRTLKFRCELATSTGESFEDGSEFTEPDSALRRVADPRRVDPRATDKLEKPEVSAG